MKFVCEKCGFEEELGKFVDIKDIRRRCPNCGSQKVFLVDTGGIDIKLTGITPDFLKSVADQIAGSITLKDLLNFFKKEK